MPITKSAKKALKKSLKKQKGNLIYKIKVKKLLKEVKGLISQKKIEEAKKILPKIYQILDKATKTGVIKKGTADRKKSCLTKSIFKPHA
ncbi:hypothetical protein AMJ49_00450 [Parcubacteria bacterium DG_74_2]|nr:MAG: hypothetical protein AMJ49_00450 [Parcubacteria bacterium DG_74_2]